ncbi:DUF2958 domain-containing protein [Variovorax paradoxus]|uniref:DUF2958 domain-containing protein n=1 Tax=Variovorax paradoxus TaxID=34073 RepID=UPI0029C8A14D|nr:DUF2958 domain-containing protein [Variovorax paradoxus]WPH18059.1 DUF2958 domain-containing protein [Variovorax paradoxus]
MIELLGYCLTDVGLAATAAWTTLCSWPKDANPRKKADLHPASTVKLLLLVVSTTLLMTKIDLDNNGHAFGLRDLGLGKPKLY